jgi:hypothetical protein
LVRADQSDCPLLAPIHSLYTQSRVHPQPVHTTVLPPPQTRLYGVRPMGRTPIYDQLRGERINADVPAAEAGPQVGGRRGRHHVLVVAPGPAAVAGPPGPSTGLDGNRHHLLETSSAVQPAGDGDARSRWGDREQLFRWQPTRGKHRHTTPAAPRRCPAPATTPQPRAQQQVITVRTGDRGVDRDRHRTHTEPRTAAPADAQFSWF